MRNAMIAEKLNAITSVRTAKYEEEVQRQKDAIEAALIKFMEDSKSCYEKITHATINHQTQNTIWFTHELDADVLPEVADFIAEEYDLSVSKDYPYKVCGSYQV